MTSASALELNAQRNAVTSAASSSGPRGAGAAATMRLRDSALATYAPRLGARVARQVAAFRTATAHSVAAQRDDSAARDVRVAEVMVAARQLDSALGVRQATQRARIEALEAEDALLPSMLTPILAAAMFAIYWAGRRIAMSAKAAELSRLALVAAQNEKVTLLRGLTHDLKNALGAARGYTMLLVEEVSGPLSARQREQLARIRHILDHTIASVQDALLVARTEAGTLPVRRQQTDMRTLLLDAAADYVADAERAELTLSVEFPDDLPLVGTDASLVAKIVGNLLSNAIKYTPGRGRIWLRASRKARSHDFEVGEWIAVEVCDTGPGIPVELRERVFDEFFRAPTVVATAKGEGIGLAMSRRVARLLNGDITLGVEEEGRTCFTLWLPAASSADTDMTRAQTGNDVRVSLDSQRSDQPAPRIADAPVDYDRGSVSHLRAAARTRMSILLVAIVLVAMGAGACQRVSRGGRDTVLADGTIAAVASPTPVAHNAGRVPPSIVAIGEIGEMAYDMVRRADWKPAHSAVDSLRVVLAKARASRTIADSSLGLVITALDGLEWAIGGRDSGKALREANRLTKLGADLSRRYVTPVPPEVALLDYEGRELQIWAGVCDSVRLRETTLALRRTWNDVRPRVDARGGRREADHFETLVTQVERGRNSAELARLAVPVLDAVDTLEQLFARART
ncbi:MAG TPA: HAMP domain-containing sensor histidine kinase [Gemmatimonadaceae bacterium]|nr:HAMP domain-containing sensor histidine kinase [Gemmatimonadaceae bacterium]